MSAPSHRRGAAVDDAILGATIEEIADAGTCDIRVDRVAERAGINKTTIYRRYPTVGDLVLAAALANAEQHVPLPDTGDLRDDLDAFATSVRDAISTPLGRALLRAASGPVAEFRAAFWSTRLSIAAVTIGRAVDRGDIEPVEHPEEHIEQLVAPIHFRVLQLEGVADDAFVGEQVSRVLAELGGS